MAKASPSTQPIHVRWDDKAKGVLPMPGGYDGYFDSLQWTAESAQDAPLSQSELTARMADQFGLTENAARSRLSFLKKVGFLGVDSGVWVLPEFIKRWLLDRDPAPLVARLHHKVQFIGEMLKSLEQPRTTADLRSLACEKYLMGWETNTQINNRRGWLQSAGLIERDSDGLFCLTDDGSGFLDLVVVQPALDRQIHETMDLQEYADRAATTDGLGSDEKAIRIALFGIAGEAGEVVSEAKKFFREGGPMTGLGDRISEELGDLLWYVALLARRLNLDLNDVAEKNLHKTDALWSPTMPSRPNYDDHAHDRQKLLRQMRVEFVEDQSGEIPVVRMVPQGELALIVHENW